MLLSLLLFAVLTRAFGPEGGGDGLDGGDETNIFDKVVNLEAAPEVLSNAVMQSFELINTEGASGLQIATGIVDILTGLSGMIPHPAGSIIGAVLGLASFFMKFGAASDPVADPVLEAIQNLYNQLSMKIEAVQNELTFQIETQGLNEAMTACRTKYKVMEEFANDSTPDLEEYEKFVNRMASHDSDNALHPRNALAMIHAKITGEVGVPIMATFLSRYSTSEDSSADTKSAKYWKQLQNANIMCGSVIFSALMMAKDEDSLHSGDEFMKTFNANLGLQYQFHYELTDMYGRDNIGSEYNLVFPLDQTFALRDNGFHLSKIEVSVATEVYVCTSAVNCPPSIYDVTAVFETEDLPWAVHEEKKIDISGFIQPGMTVRTLPIDDTAQGIAISYSTVEIANVYTPDASSWVEQPNSHCVLFDEVHINGVGSQIACQDICTQKESQCCGINYSHLKNPDNPMDNICGLCYAGCSVSQGSTNEFGFYAKPSSAEEADGHMGPETVVLLPPEDLMIGGLYGWSDGEYIRKLGVFWMPRPMEDISYLDLAPPAETDGCPIIDNTFHQWDEIIIEDYKQCGFPDKLCTCSLPSLTCRQLTNTDLTMPTDTCQQPGHSCYPGCFPEAEVLTKTSIFPSSDDAIVTKGAVPGTFSGYDDLGIGECRDKSGQYPLQFELLGHSFGDYCVQTCNAIDWCLAVQNSNGACYIVSEHNAFDAANPFNSQFAWSWGQQVSYGDETFQVLDGGDGHPKFNGLPFTLHNRDSYACYVRWNFKTGVAKRQQPKLKVELFAVAAGVSVGVGVVFALFVKLRRKRKYNALEVV